jgi:hypothetical protein
MTLQVRKGALGILDHKPDARANRPFVRLTIYALALTNSSDCASSTLSARGSTRSSTGFFPEEQGNHAHSRHLFRSKLR